MATTLSRSSTKHANPLTTALMAAFLTWKQFDILLLLANHDSPMETSELAGLLLEIRDYDEHHGGVFYGGVYHQGVYSSMRTLERRTLVLRHERKGKPLTWTISARGKKALLVLTG